MKRIYLAGDHAGFELKEKLKKYLDSLGIKYYDFGPYEYNPRDDYPDFVIPFAEKISKEEGIGVVIAGSGVGECICANRFKNVRAVLYHGGSEEIIRVSREHDNSNVLCVGSRFVSFRALKKVLNLFFEIKFKKGRHSRRLSKFEKKGI